MDLLLSYHKSTMLPIDLYHLAAFVALLLEALKFDNAFSTENVHYLWHNQKLVRLHYVETAMGWRFTILDTHKKTKKNKYWNAQKYS